MGMREEFEKCFEQYCADNGYLLVSFARHEDGTYSNQLTRKEFDLWQAAYLAGAKAMQEEAAKVCAPYIKEYDQGFGTADFIEEAIRAIDPAKLKEEKK